MGVCVYELVLVELGKLLQFFLDPPVFKFNFTFKSAEALFELFLLGSLLVVVFVVALLDAFVVQQFE